MGEVVAYKKSRERAAACSDPLLVQRRNHLTQREVRVLTGEGKDPFLMLLQWRNTSSTGHWLRTPVVAKAFTPPDRGTDTDVELLGRLTSRSSFLDETNDAHSQFSVIRSTHWPSLRRINALDSLIRYSLGIPDSLHPGRAVVEIDLLMQRIAGEQELFGRGKCLAVEA